MKNSLTIVVLALVLAALPLHAQRRRATAPSAGALSIEFVDVPEQGAALIAAGSDAWIDVRTISQQAGSNGGRSVRVRRRFGIRIVRAGGVLSGTAIVTARLDSPDGRSSVRIDGQPLAATPLVVSARAAVGAVMVHLLEIEVASTVAEGPLAASISWEATTQ
ncbi:MAG: hypothetical protein QOC81_2577 [Thermoanaerobaculia bacterium]|jgi:hypothetical protein|nr:hypothetical protein [Thermoanaerobaculia bacterium]